MSQSYTEQLYVVRVIAQDGRVRSLRDEDLAALQAVLAHYDVYVAAARASMALASYDDLSTPVQDLTAPEDPHAINVCRTALDDALTAMMACEDADAYGISPA